MSQLVNPSPGLFFGSALYNGEKISQSEVLSFWSDRFGKSIEFHHPFFPMREYYSRQMGKAEHLKRFILFSLTPEPREKLVEHKIWADDLEKKIENEYGLRGLNLDIGLLTAENVSLATGKNFAHRTYLSNGVFSDLTYQIDHKNFKTLPWTYPDYAHEDFIQLFSWLRGFLLRKNSEKIT